MQGERMTTTRRRTGVWAALCCAVTLAACNPAGLGVDAPGGAAALPEPDSIKEHASATESEYRIAAQDVLEINVYQFPNLSRTAQVDGSGRLSMPLLGAVNAAGKTVHALETEIASKLGAKYLQSPQVSVFVKESVGARVTLDGAVRNPGVYTLKGKTTLLQAISLAQGLNDVGDSTVTLTRIADGRQVSTRIDIGGIRTGAMRDPQVFGGDTIFVDESVTRTGLQVLKNTVPAVIGLGVKAVP